MGILGIRVYVSDFNSPGVWGLRRSPGVLDLTRSFFENPSKTNVFGLNPGPSSAKSSSKKQFLHFYLQSYPKGPSTCAWALKSLNRRYFNDQVVPIDVHGPLALETVCQSSS